MTYTTEQITEALQEFVRFIIGGSNDELSEAILGLLAKGLISVGDIKNGEFGFKLPDMTVH